MLPASTDWSQVEARSYPVRSDSLRYTPLQTRQKVASSSDVDESFSRDTPQTEASDSFTLQSSSNFSLTGSSIGLLASQPANSNVEKPLPLPPKKIDKTKSHRPRRGSWFGISKKPLEDAESSPGIEKIGKGRLSISSPILQSATRPDVAASEGVRHGHQETADPALFSHRTPFAKFEKAQIQKQESVDDCGSGGFAAPTASSFHSALLAGQQACQTSKTGSTAESGPGDFAASTRAVQGVNNKLVRTLAEKSLPYSGRRSVNERENDFAGDVIEHENRIGRVCNSISRRLSGTARSNPFSIHRKFASIAEEGHNGLRTSNQAEAPSRRVDEITEPPTEKVQTLTGHDVVTREVSTKQGCDTRQPLPEVVEATQSVKRKPLPPSSHLTVPNIDSNYGPYYDTQVESNNSEANKCFTDSKRARARARTFDSDAQTPENPATSTLPLGQKRNQHEQIPKVVVTRPPCDGPRHASESQDGPDCVTVTNIAQCIPMVSGVIPRWLISLLRLPLM